MLDPLRRSVTDNSWLYAVPAGLLSAAYVVLTAPSPDTLHFGIVFWAGLFGGLLAVGGSKDAQDVGFRTGVVASLASLWQVGPILGVIPTFDQPPAAGVVQVILVLSVVVIAALLTGLAGAVGAAAGNWLSEKVGSEPSVPASG